MDNKEVKQLLNTVRSDLRRINPEKHVAGFSALKSLESELEKQEYLEETIEEYKEQLEEYKIVSEEATSLLHAYLFNEQKAQDENKRLQKIIKRTNEIEKKSVKEQKVNERKIFKRLRGKNKLVESEATTELMSLSERLVRVAKKSDLRRNLSQFIDLIQAVEIALPFLEKYKEDIASNSYRVTEEEVTIVYANISTALAELDKVLP